MFSGIIQSQGTIVDRTQKAGVVQFRIQVSELTTEQKALGNSIAVNGCCVTVTESTHQDFSVDCSEETLRLTNFSDLRVGDRVNIESPVTLQTALHGHIVLGHIDGLGTLKRVEQKGESFVIEITVPADLMRYMAKKGSLTVNGISLTINDASADSVVLTIIPHTWRVTNLNTLSLGAKLNLEADMLARYVERLMLG